MSPKKSLSLGILLGASIVLTIAATPIKDLVFQSNPDAAGHQIDNLGTPTDANHAATKGYVDTNTVPSTRLAGSGTITANSSGTLGNAAFSSTSAFATAASGTLANSALQPYDSIANTADINGATQGALDNKMGFSDDISETSGINVDIQSALDGKLSLTGESTVSYLAFTDGIDLSTATVYGAPSLIDSAGWRSNLELGSAAEYNASDFLSSSGGTVNNMTILEGFTLSGVTIYGTPVFSATAAWRAALGVNFTGTGGVSVSGTTISGVQASTSQQGVMYIATNTETQNGSTSVKAVVPTGLASWWTNAKTLAQTIAGAWTFSADTVQNGTNNTAPNQTAASGASLMTRDLNDLRYFVGNPLNYGRGVYAISPAAGTVSGTGTFQGTPNVGGMRISSGTAAASSVLWRPNSSALTRFARGSSVAGVQFSRPVWLVFGGQMDLRTVGIARIQLGRLYNDAAGIADFTPGASSHGMGFYLAGGEIKLETCNSSTRTLSASLGTYSTSAAFLVDLKARSDGAGGVRVWINGVETSPQTGGPTADTGSSYVGVNFSVESGAGGATCLIDATPSGQSVFVE